MNGSKVARTGDAAAGKLCLHVIAIDEFRQADYVDEPAYGTAGESERREFQTRNVLEQSVVARGGSLAQGEHLADAAKLHPAQRAGQFREAVVVAHLTVVEPSGRRLAALIAQAAQTIGLGAGCASTAPPSPVVSCLLG